MYSVSKGGISRARETIIMSTLCVMIFVMFLSNDIHAPNIREIGEDLRTTEDRVRLLFIISSFFTYFMQLIWGAFADFCKRKKLIIVCSSFVIVGKFFAIFANTFSQMMIARIIEYSALGGLWAAVSCICSDICKTDAKRIAKVFAVIDMLYPMAIMIGPFIGERLGSVNLNYITGWRLCYAAMFICSTIFFVIAFITIKETSWTLQKFNAKNAFANYITLLKNKTFTSCSILYMTCATAIQMLQTSSPYCYMQHFNVTKKHFTFLYNMPVLFGIIFTIIYIFLIQRTTFKTIMNIGVTICFLFLVFSIFYLCHTAYHTPIIFAAITSMIFCVERFVVPNVDAIFVSFCNTVSLAQKYALMHSLSAIASSLFTYQCSKYYTAVNIKDSYLVACMMISVALFIVVYFTLFKKNNKYNV